MRNSLKSIGPGIRFQLLFLLVFASILPSTANQQPDHPAAKTATYSKVYRNSVYGYELLIPIGLKAVGPSPPNPNHGVRMDLPGSAMFIWVDAHYVDQNSLSSAADATISQLKETCGEPENLKRSGGHIGRLRAIRLEYKCLKDPPSYNIRYVAFRSEKGFAPILYELCLTGAQEEFSQGRNMGYFNIILTDLKFLPPN